MPKEMKPKRATLTAADRRMIREVLQAELLPLRDEVKKLRKANYAKLDIIHMLIDRIEDHLDPNTN